MYSCTWTCHNYLEFNVLRFTNAPISRHVCFFLWSLWLYFAKVWHMNKSNLFFFGLSKIGDGCFFLFFIFSLRVVAENNGLYDPLLDLYILQAEFIPNSVFPGGPSVTHYFIWWLLGTNVDSFVSNILTRMVNITNVIRFLVLLKTNWQNVT